MNFEELKAYYKSQGFGDEEAALKAKYDLNLSQEDYNRYQHPTRYNTGSMLKSAADGIGLGATFVNPTIGGLYFLGTGANLIANGHTEEGVTRGAMASLPGVHLAISKVSPTVGSWFGAGLAGLFGGTAASDMVENGVNGDNAVLLGLALAPLAPKAIHATKLVSNAVSNKQNQKKIKRFFTPHPILSKRLLNVIDYQTKKHNTAAAAKEKYTDDLASSRRQLDRLYRDARIFSLLAKNQVWESVTLKLKDLERKYKSAAFQDVIDRYIAMRQDAHLRNAADGVYDYVPRKLWSMHIGKSFQNVINPPYYQKRYGDFEPNSYLDRKFALKREFDRIMNNDKTDKFWKSIRRNPNEGLAIGPSSPFLEVFTPEKRMLQDIQKNVPFPKIKSAKRAEHFNKMLSSNMSTGPELVLYELVTDKTSPDYGYYVPTYRQITKSGPIVGTKTGEVNMPDPINDVIEHGTVQYEPSEFELTNYVMRVDPLGKTVPQIESITKGDTEGLLLVSDNYIRALANMLKYIRNLTGGATYDMGSAVGVTRLGLPHITHDADVFIIDSDFNKLVNRGVIPNPVKYREGRTYKSDLFNGKYINGDLFGYDSYGRPNNPGMVDFNIIETDPTTGHAVGFNASEILRLFYPEQYQEALNTWFNTGRPLTANGFKDIKTNMSPRQLMSRYSPELKTLMDQLEIDALIKNKQLGRDYNYLAVAPVDALNEAISMHAKSFVGPTVLLPPDLTSEFLDIPRNLKILDMLGIEGIDRLRIARDPKRMQAIFNLNYLRRSTIGRGTDLTPFTRELSNWDPEDVAAYSKLFADGLNRSVGNAKKFLTRWNSGYFTNPDTGKTLYVRNNGEGMHGTLNAVEMGDSRSFKDIYGFMQFGIPEFAKTPEGILQLLAYNTGQAPVTKEQATYINNLFSKYFSGNPIIKEGLNLNTIVDKIPNYKGEVISDFYDELGRYLNIQGIVTSDYANGTRFAFPILKNWEPSSMHYGYGNTELEYRTPGDLRDPIPNSISFRNHKIKLLSDIRPNTNRGRRAKEAFDLDRIATRSSIFHYLDNPNLDALILWKYRNYDRSMLQLMERNLKIINKKGNQESKNAYEQVWLSYDPLIKELENTIAVLNDNISKLELIRAGAYRNMNVYGDKKRSSDASYKNRLIIGGTLAGMGALFGYAKYNSNAHRRRFKLFKELYPNSAYKPRDFIYPNPKYANDSTYWFGPFYNHTTGVNTLHSGDWDIWTEDRKFEEGEISRKKKNYLEWLNNYNSNPFLSNFVVNYKIQ